MTATLSPPTILSLLSPLAGIYIGLKGTLETFDKIAAAVAAGKEKVDDAITRATEAAAALNDETKQRASELYIRILNKVRRRGADAGQAWRAGRTPCAASCMCIVFVRTNHWQSGICCMCVCVLARVCVLVCVPRPHQTRGRLSHR